MRLALCARCAAADSPKEGAFVAGQQAAALLPPFESDGSGTSARDREARTYEIFPKFFRIPCTYPHDPARSLLLLPAGLQQAHVQWRGRAPKSSPYMGALDTMAESPEAQCLRGERDPPRECDAGWNSPGCLRAPVPPWSLPYERVQACFRCCLLNSTARLRHKHAFWRHVLLREANDPWDRQTGRQVGQTRGVDGDDSVVLGNLWPMRYADVGATYANRSLVRPHHPTPAHDSAAASPRANGSLACVWGWTLQSAKALDALWQAWPRMASPKVVLTIGDQALPLQSHPSSRKMLAAPDLARWCVEPPGLTTREHAISRHRRPSTLEHAFAGT